jgi:hypothetical protein
MAIAKEDLRDGFVLVAAKGTYVSNDVVKQHGWEDKVEAGDDIIASTGEDGEQKDSAAPKGKPQKGK